MNEYRLEEIISSEIDKAVNEQAMINEGLGDIFKSIASSIGNYFKKHKKKKDDKKKDSKKKDDGKKEKSDSKKKDSSKKQKKKKVRKLVGGKESYYDYDEYEKNNTKVGANDADAIRREIDTDRTNIRSLAKDVMPGYTESGGQSYLRKMLNGERPMTTRVAQALNKEISKGNVATK